MNDFLRDFSSPDKRITTNNELYQHLQTDAEASKRFDVMVVEARNHKAQLFNDQPELKTEKQFDSFVKKHRLWASDKTILLMADAKFKFIDYKTYELSDDTVAEMLADVVATKYASELYLVHPLNTLERENIDKNIEQLKELHHQLDSAAREVQLAGVLNHVITNRHATAPLAEFLELSRTSHGIFIEENDFDPEELIEQARADGAMNLPVLPTLPYKQGFEEFCEYYATETLQGKNLWKNNREVQNLVKLSYEFYDYEKVGVLWLDENAKIIEMETLASGTADRVPLDADMVSNALTKNEIKQWACFHNHPTGDHTPSDSDINTTNMLEAVTKKLDKPLIEHYIIGSQDLFEFSKHAELTSELAKNAEVSRSNHDTRRETSRDF